MTPHATPNLAILVLPARTNPDRRFTPVLVPGLVPFPPAPLTETAQQTAKENTVSIPANQVTPSQETPVSKTVFRMTVRLIL